MRLTCRQVGTSKDQVPDDEQVYNDYRPAEHDTVGGMTVVPPSSSAQPQSAGHRPLGQHADDPQ